MPWNAQHVTGLAPERSAKVLAGDGIDFFQLSRASAALGGWKMASTSGRRARYELRALSQTSAHYFDAPAL